ncbi:MAG: hypothetical protein K2P17_04840 [Helicobacteraceae bacterium]|nr:hypothetical protein [Helicobacteraceae bacterium]
MKEKINQCILKALNNLADELDNDELKSPTNSTIIWGGVDGILDSLALVSFIADLESLINEEFNKEIILANEKAMSERNSPFRNINTLNSYIQQCLKENNE